MSETEANGPLDERVNPAPADIDKRADSQAECERLREQVRQLTEECDGLRENETVLRSDYKESLRSLFDYLEKRYGEVRPWPEDEKVCIEFRQIVEELEKELEDLRHAGQL